MTPNMTAIWEALFWCTACLLLYVYAGYPILVGVLARFVPREEEPPVAFQSSVTLLISAYNESAVMAEKLENSLALDYRKDLLEIVVISDCSDDGTDDIVHRYGEFGVRLVRQNQRQGKSAGLNLAVPQAKGQILVFSDANALYRPDAIRHLLCHFVDPRVGYVVGNSRYVEKASLSNPAEAEGLYWKLETWLKQKESAFYSVVGGDGAIYAIRQELYSPLRPTDISDFLNPLQIIDRGYLGIFEPAAVSYEETAESFSREFRRKVRIVSRSLNAVRRADGILNPFRWPRHWLLLVSHKLLRWFAPIFMIGMFTASLALWKSPFFRVAGLLQVLFYTMALIGWALQSRERSWRIFSLAFYFCLVNVASLVGCFKCLRGDLSGTWMPPRQNASSKA
jgi:cellulose synthase/poly-beta-1,6-N-acetylglucosamine synthase-like glycosyltransferase